MDAMEFNNRKSGLPLIGDLPWGAHFCHFYQTKQDILDILGPYFQAGLENNEHCIWVTSRPISIADAKKELLRVVPDFASYVKKGQIEIIPYRRWCSGERTAGGTLVTRIDKAIFRGFDGLRLSCHAFSEKRGNTTLSCCDDDVIDRYNIIAAFAYPRDRFDALGLMEVVRNHRFALVRNAGKWEIIESSEVRIIKDDLKKSQEKLHSLFNNMSEGFAYHRIVLDAEGKPCDYVFLEVNEAFERLTGLKGEKIIGKRVTKALPGIEKDPTGWIEKYGKVALTGTPIHFESRAEPLNRWYAISAFSPHRGFFAVTFSDVTARKQAEERIVALNEELKRNVDDLSAANEDLESFSYSISHDLRAPLRAIDGYSKLLVKECEGKLDAEGRRLLGVIRKNVLTMAQLINDLLAFSRLGRQKVSVVEINMKDLAETVYEEIKSTAPGRVVAFAVKNPPLAFADKTMMRQVMVNLLTNAVKFTQPRAHAAIEFGGRVDGTENVYYVKDNGVGFDMRYADKLFGVFQRLHGVDEFEGTGVGLAIVKRTVLKHGGRVWAEGEIDQGATIYFTLPIRTASPYALTPPGHRGGSDHNGAA